MIWEFWRNLKLIIEIHMGGELPARFYGETVEISMLYGIQKMKDGIKERARCLSKCLSGKWDICIYVVHLLSSQ